MKLIPIYGKGGCVVAQSKVDETDFAALNRCRWHLSSDGYAQRSWRRADGTTRTVTMQRQILGLQQGERLYGDHINRDRLDNRRRNLRAVTPEQSAQNRAERATSLTGHRGVNFVKTTGKFIARVRIGSPGKLYNLGTYSTAEEAARIAAAFRAEHMPFSEEAAA